MYAFTPQPDAFGNPGAPGGAQPVGDPHRDVVIEHTPLYVLPSDTPANQTHGPEARAASPRVHMRWGHLLLLMVAIALVALAVANLLSGTKATSASVSGSGTTRSTNDESDRYRDTISEVRPLRSAEPPTTPPARVARPSPSAHGGGSHPHRSAHGGGSHPHSSVRTQDANPRPAAALPYTGAPTWLAGIIGTLLVVLGVGVQLRAPTIASTASQYRRGPLLRPIWLITRTPLVYRHFARWCG
jgi:hypothetical protein